MKMITCTLLFVLITVKTSFSQDFEWAKHIAGTNLTYIHALKTDALGNAYTAGEFINTADFDPGPATYPLTGQYRDAFIQKLDKDGNFVWAIDFGDADYQAITDLELDLQGNIYVIGDFKGSPDFDPGPGTTILNAIGITEVFIAKYDNSGNFIWAKNIRNTISTGSYIHGQSIELNQQGEIYVCGNYSGPADFDPSAANYINGTIQEDGFIAKYDNWGGFLWMNELEGSGNEGFSQIELDSMGHIYSTGYFEGTVDFDPSVNVFNLTAGAYNGFIMEWNSMGDLVWAKTIYDGIIGLDLASNIYITNTFFDTLDTDPGAGVNLLISDAVDVQLTKLSSTGNFIWTNHITNSATIRVNSIEVDLFDRVHIGGDYFAPTDFDLSMDSFVLGGSDEVYLSSYTYDGVFITAKKFANAPTASNVSYIATSPMGNVHIGGLFYGTISVDSSLPSLTNPPLADGIYIAKVYNNCIPMLDSISATACETYVSPSRQHIWNTSGVYQDTLNKYGCDSILTIDLTILSATSATKSVSRCAPYTFNGQTYTTSGVYSTTISNSVGCDSVLALIVTINYLDNTVSLNGDTLMANATGSNLTYEWIDCATNTPIPNETNQTFAPTINGDYAVLISNNSCDTLSACQAFVLTNLNSITTSTIEITPYPNPHEDRFYLNLASIDERMGLEVLNAVGQSVPYTKRQVGNKLTIHIKATSGIYFLRIKKSNIKDQYFKIIKTNN